MASWGRSPSLDKTGKARMKRSRSARAATTHENKPARPVTAGFQSRGTRGRATENLLEFGGSAKLDSSVTEVGSQQP
jgi:hypothetical protein